MAKKWYILTQLSFWFQQIFVINIEAPRKDHYQMLTHHLITSTLVASAYIYRFYNVSNVVLCLMDVVDFLLPVRDMPLNFKVAETMLTPRRLRKSSSTLGTRTCATPPSWCSSSLGLLHGKSCSRCYAGRSTRTCPMSWPTGATRARRPRC